MMSTPQLVGILAGIFALFCIGAVVSVAVMIGRMSESEHQDYVDRMGDGKDQ